MCSNGGIQFDIYAKKDITITSITFGTYENCKWRIFLSGRPYQRTNPSEWTQIAQGASKGPRKKSQQVTLSPIRRLNAGRRLGVYLYGDNSRGILFKNYSSGYTADNEFLRIERGCAMRRTLFESQGNDGGYEFVGTIGYISCVGREGKGSEKTFPVKKISLMKSGSISMTNLL